MSQGDFFEGDAPLHGAKQTDDSGENTGCGCGGGKANPAPAVAPPRTNSNGGCGCSSGASQPSAAAELADSACFGTLVRDNCCRCEGLACGNNCGCGRGRVGREGGREGGGGGRQRRRRGEREGEQERERENGSASFTSTISLDLSSHHSRSLRTVQGQLGRLDQALLHRAPQREPRLPRPCPGLAAPSCRGAVCDPGAHVLLLHAAAGQL